MTGALTVPKDKNIAVEQAFYFCTMLASALICCNIRYPLKFISDRAADADKVKAVDNLEIVFNNMPIDFILSIDEKGQICLFLLFFYILLGSYMLIEIFILLVMLHCIHFHKQHTNVFP